MADETQHVKVRSANIPAYIGWACTIAVGIYHIGITQADFTAANRRGDDHEARLRALEKQAGERLSAIEQRILDIARTLDRMEGKR